MTRNSPASAIALMVVAFTIPFFATVLIRKATRAADVPPSEWTANAKAAARTREREESLINGIDTLKLESKRLSEQVARKSQELSASAGKAQGAASETADPKARPAFDQLAASQGMKDVQRKLQSAKEEFGLTAPQVASYEARLREAVEKNPLEFIDGDDRRFDEEGLAPLLDRAQLAKFRERTQAQVELKAKAERGWIAGLLQIPPDDAARVSAVLREEGVGDENAFIKAADRPERLRELTPRFASATDRARARLRPMLTPEAFQKLDQQLKSQADDIRFLAEEFEKATEE